MWSQTRLQPVLLGGSVPIDHHPEDRAELVGETVPDGTRVCRDQEFEKTWEVRNSGERRWRNRWLTRQGAAGAPGWLRSPLRAPVPDAAPGDIVTVSMPLQAPSQVGASSAYFKLTDEAGRLYYPRLESPPHLLHHLHHLRPVGWARSSHRDLGHLI